MRYISDITIVHSPTGISVYAGGKFLVEGKDLSIAEVLRKLGFDVEEREAEN